MIKTLLFDLTEKFPFFFGFKKLTFLLRSRFGIIINKKKGYRLCKEKDLLLPIVKHYISSSSEIVFKKVSVESPNIHWQMDIPHVTLFPKIIFC